MCQGFRIGQGVGVVDLETVDRSSHSDLADLSADRARDVGDRKDDLRNVARRAVRLDLLLDSAEQIIVQLVSLPEYDEENDSLVPVPLLPHGYALYDFV